jgi:hypothetical protein
MPDRIPEPWLSFLRDLDQALRETVEVHCLGGFVLSVLGDCHDRPGTSTSFKSRRSVPERPFWGWQAKELLWRRNTISTSSM